MPAVELGAPVLRVGLQWASAAGWRVQGGKADTETGALVLRGRPGWIAKTLGGDGVDETYDQVNRHARARDDRRAEHDARIDLDASAAHLRPMVMRVME